MTSTQPARDPQTAKILQLGSGLKKDLNAFNVDIQPSTQPDLVHDLNQLPWPLADLQFEKVLAFDVLEHLDDLVKVMEEIHRVCKPGANVHVTVPHFSSSNAFTDPTHRHYFSSQSFHYFTGESEFSFYTRHRFRTVHSKLIFYPSTLNRAISRLANNNREQYERRWAWIFPAWFLYFELEVKKPSDEVGH